MILTIGDIAPDFTLPTHTEKTVTLSHLKGQNVVLYFYPKDSTPGCTKQACDFRDTLPQFEKLNATIIGVSKDSIKSHKTFSLRYQLNFFLASDEDGRVCNDYHVWGEKQMYGRTYFGIERSTFLIDTQGKIRQLWRNVKVAGHVEQVKNELERL